MDVAPDGRAAATRSARASYETDRARFIGAAAAPADPAALDEAGAAAVQHRRLGARSDRRAAAHGHAGARRDPPSVRSISGVAETREAALALVGEVSRPASADRAFELAWTHSQVILRQLNATEAEAQLYGRLAGVR